MKRIALISGATGFLGGELFTDLQRDRLFDEIVLVGKTRHMDSLQQLVRLHPAQRVSVVELSGLEKHLEEKDHTSEVFALILSNSFIRSTDSLDYGQYFLDILLDTKALIAALTPYKPYVLYPLSWHSWRAFQTPYSTAKNAVEQMLLGYEALGMISLGRVALFDTYGPNDKRDKLIPSLLKAQVPDASMAVSNPHARINVTHSDDVVRGIRIMLEARLRGLYQIRYPSDVRIWEVAKFLGRWPGPVPDFLESADDELPSIPAKFPPGWSATISPEAGLRNLSFGANG